MRLVSAVRSVCIYTSAIHIASGWRRPVSCPWRRSASIYWTTALQLVTRISLNTSRSSSQTRKVEVSLPSCPQTQPPKATILLALCCCFPLYFELSFPRDNTTKVRRLDSFQWRLATDSRSTSTRLRPSRPRRYCFVDLEFPCVYICYILPCCDVYRERERKTERLVACDSCVRDVAVFYAYLIFVMRARDECRNLCRFIYNLLRYISDGSSCFGLCCAAPVASYVFRLCIGEIAGVSV